MSRAPYLPTTEAAAMIRKDLKAAFPDAKFSVRTKKYSGGSSIDIDWTDGPTGAAVEAIAKRYNGRHFDGMTDSTSYSDVHASDGNVYSAGCFVFCHHSHSVAAMQAALEAEQAYWGGEEGEAMKAATVVEGWKGSGYVHTAGMNGRMADFVQRSVRERLEGKREEQAEEFARWEAEKAAAVAEPSLAGFHAIEQDIAAAVAAPVEPARPALYILPPITEDDDDEPAVDDSVSNYDEYPQDHTTYAEDFEAFFG